MWSKKQLLLTPFLLILLITVIIFMVNPKKTPEYKDYPHFTQSGIIHIVTIPDPVGYFIDGDTVAGYTYELLKALETYSGFTFDIQVENSLEQSLQELDEGRFDVVARNIPVNTELKLHYLFTDPILYNKLVLVQRKSDYNSDKDPIRNHLQLAGETIYVAENSPHIFRLQNLSHEIGDSIFIVEDPTYQPNQLAMMVAGGDIQYTILDKQTAEKTAEKLPELDIETDIGFTHLEAWAVRHSSPILLDSLNQWINQFRTTKQYEEIYNKYYK